MTERCAQGSCRQQSRTLQTVAGHGGEDLGGEAGERHERRGKRCRHVGAGTPWNIWARYPGAIVAHNRWLCHQPQKLAITTPARDEGRTARTIRGPSVGVLDAGHPARSIPNLLIQVGRRARAPLHGRRRAARCCTVALFSHSNVIPGKITTSSSYGTIYSIATIIYTRLF